MLPKTSALICIYFYEHIQHIHSNIYLYLTFVYTHTAHTYKCIYMSLTACSLCTRAK